MLAHAGVSFVLEPSAIDEGPIKARCKSDGSSSGQTALALAAEKARKVAERRRAALVIGSDQILECDGDWFNKPASRAEAIRSLKVLRNRSHILVSAVTVMRDDMCLWRFVDSAKLTMRFFSDDFLRRYIDDGGDAILSSVGAYRIEGTGIQLFSRIEGDYFTVQGMPLLPLLDCLRRYNALAR